MKGRKGEEAKRGKGKNKSLKIALKQSLSPFSRSLPKNHYRKKRNRNYLVWIPSVFLTSSSGTDYLEKPTFYFSTSLILF